MAEDKSMQDYKYVQIKMQSIKQYNKQQYLIQIIDISGQIMYDIATGEKKFLQLINATVSHEMRNPINSIKS